MQLTEGTLLQEGKYRIEGILGQGGFGITYKAIMQVEVKGPLGMIQTEIHVAIKEFFMKELCNRDEQTCQVSVPSSGSVQYVESYRKKFWKEAQNLSKLNHPNIVNVLDVFNENNTSYYVMEYISGGSLQQYVKQQGAIPEETALTYIRQLASALDYMHQNHVCHLDLKPGNVLMDDKKLQVKLIDFGLSKQYDDEGGQTSSTPVGISEGYAPTEQYEMGGVSEFSPATDIYSLGATLYFLLSGVRPPKASIVLNDGLPELPATVSVTVQKTVERAMSPRRKARPQNIEEFLGLLNPQMEEIDENTFIVNHEIETADITPEQQTEDPITPIKVRDEESQDLLGSAKESFNKYIIPIFLLILFIGIWYASNQSDEPHTISPSPRDTENYLTDYTQLQIGDYYYSDGSFSHEKHDSKECVGIVFSLETTTAEKQRKWTHGQIVALKDANNGIPVPWGDDQDLPFVKTIQDISDARQDRDGFIYTSEVSTKIISSPATAFRAAAEYLAPLPEGKTSGWYLPAAGQWYDIITNLTSEKIKDYNNTLAIFDNDKISEILQEKINAMPIEYQYWTATEKGEDTGDIISERFSRNRAWAIYYGDPDGYLGNSPKSNKMNVRSIAAF